MNERLYTITELVEYYCDRYGITDSNKDVQKATSQAMRQKLTRLLQEEMFEDVSLYDVMNRKKENEKEEELTRQPRVITIDLFEKFCFENWIRYIEKNYGGKIENYKNWKRDLKRLEEIENLKKYKDIADKNNNLDEKEIARQRDLTEIINKYMEEHEGEPIVSSDDVLKEAHIMMLEAIYHKFYSGFDWKKLKDDMEWKLAFDSNVGAENAAESYRAIDRLKDFSKSFKHYVIEYDNVDDAGDTPKDNE